MASFSSLMHMRPCHHHDGIVALVTMALLPSMRRHLCRCCDCGCPPHDIGVVVVVDAQVSLPSLSRCCCPCNKCVIALNPHWHCCPCSNGVVAILKLALLPLFQWHHCHHQCADILAIIAIVLLPLLQWHCCRQCPGIFAVIIAIVALMTMVSSPLLMLHVLAIVKIALLP
jgi:hypothetical protein